MNTNATSLRKSVRLVFAQDNLPGYLNVHLDNIALNIGSVGPTSFDVYFGTNPYPDADDFLGTTTNNFMPLPQLAGGTDYYWRIESKRAGQTNAGPAWLFSTAGQTNGMMVMPVSTNVPRRFFRLQGY